MEILISVTLLFVGIVVLVVIHVCIAGSPFREDTHHTLGGDDKTKAASFEEIRSKLPCFAYKVEEREGDSSPVECVVCLENFRAGEKCRLLPKCSHSFHIECIDSWLLKTPICPICRTSVGSSESCFKEVAAAASGNVGLGIELI